ncbi:hypothetical protein [Clostridium sp. LCP25S3_F10]|uniref:hypothetical protein n=1 Tax=Clostridium sp. LCP25S3_F10 TaxID=3438750 RepID=UPI003F933EF2
MFLDTGEETGRKRKYSWVEPLSIYDALEYFLQYCKEYNMIGFHYKDVLGSLLLTINP